MAVATRPERPGVGGPARRRLLDHEPDRAEAARALAEGAVVGHGFANFYVITARADEKSVQGVNLMKGRPAGQVGSVTVPPDRIEPLFDRAGLPAGHTRANTLRVIDTFFGLGPFGFRGPGAPGLPACPSNDFLTAAIRSTGDDYLYITSANRSRHLTGADDTPAHWRAEGLRAEFGDQLHLLEHPDEEAARAAFARHLPMSTTILGFHAPGEVGSRRPRDRAEGPEPPAAQGVPVTRRTRGVEISWVRGRGSAGCRR